MLLHRFEDRGLSHYSYAIGCPQVGRMAVIDPRRDVDVYRQFASERGMSIAYVLETHIHADYASGARQLAEESGAELCVSGHDEGEDYEVSFSHTDLFDADEVDIGIVRLEVLHTPGHTPEHISLLAYDESRSRETPALLFSGDFLFVGSVGRPDLLGEGQQQELASRLYWSVRNLDDLPDGVEVRPAHGAGSLCGSGMGSHPTSTLGYERETNPYLDGHLSRDAFCRRLLESLPPTPRYYPRMKELNSRGPAILEELPGQQPLPASRVRKLVENGARVLDVRGVEQFASSHLPGSIWIGAGDNLSTWAGWLLDANDPLVLVADPEQVESAARSLIRVGLDDLAGYLEGGTAAWAEAGHPVEQTPQISVRQLHAELQKEDAPEVLDVRTTSEWDDGHIEGAHHLMLGDLPQRLDDAPASPLAAVCGSGYRANIAASLLEAAGREGVVNVTGGMTAWKRAGFPVQTGEAAPPEPEPEAPEEPAEAQEAEEPEELGFQQSAGKGAEEPEEPGFEQPAGMETEEPEELSEGPEEPALAPQEPA